MDLSILAGVILALGAAVAGICATHVSISYFLQPTGAVIVWGGTLGVVLVTTPEGSLVHSARRTVDLFTAHGVDGEALIEEIVTPATRTPGVARRNHVA